MPQRSNDSRPTVPTLDDVARLAGVSSATVSRCLNRPEMVAASTRDAVLAAVRTLRYSPNFGAKALAGRRTDTFGAVIPTMDNAIFARGLQAFQRRLAEHAATLLVASTDYDPERERVQIANLVARGIDGILLIGRSHDDDVYALLAERRIAVLLAWTSAGGDTLSTVGFDNERGAHELTGRTIALGHRRLAYISATLRDNDRARDRVTGVRAAMHAASLDPSALALIETHYSVDCGAAAMTTLMQARQRATVVLCGNDVLAVGAIRGARALGLRVPEDVSVTGFDDIELARLIDPPLTTVHVPHRDMGRLAADTLIGLSRATDGPQHIELPTHIVERASLAPPPNERRMQTLPSA